MYSVPFFILITVVGVISAKIDGWDTSPNVQYHIQTDEGPERYFRYQTLSGQYRKEKRLQDGTVVGSYGWVDADGYLRLNDYIADKAGYRILRNKQVYVGRQTDIDSAVTSAKYIPPQAGTEVTDNGISGIPARNSGPYSSVIPVTSTSSPYDADTPITEHLNIPYRFGSVSSTLPPYPPDSSKFLVFPSSSPSPVPANQFFRRRPTPPAGYYPTRTSTETPISEEVAITPHTYISSTLKPPRPNPIAAFPNVPPTEFSPYTSKSRSQYTPDIEQSLDTYGTKLSYADRRVSLQSEDNRYRQYDGVSVTRNGFRYYLPRHYHEEQTQQEDTKVGSFGYIDPFGIRRVIYYNASPNSGFLHRKNNRYVGFNATPYDPRP